MSTELTVKKLEKAADALPDDARSPELTGELACLRGAQKAAEVLEESAPGTPQTMTDWRAGLRRPPWQTSTRVFKGLVRLLEAVGTGLEACAGIHLGDAKGVLVSSALHVRGSGWGVAAGAAAVALPSRARPPSPTCAPRPPALFPAADCRLHQRGANFRPALPAWP